MIDTRVGAAFRAIRLRRGWRQSDVSAKAGVSRATYSRAESGRLEILTLRTLRTIAETLEVRLDVIPRWRGEELDRLVNARHSAMHEHVARLLAGMAGWVSVPEVSFAIYADRGVVDLLAWHAATRTVLVIELKTAITDAQDILGTFDRKRRLAVQIARQRAWDALVVGCWLVIADSPTNRRRVTAHSTMFRSALPNDRRELMRWLERPAGPIAALSFLAAPADSGGRRAFAAKRRVRPTRTHRSTAGMGAAGRAVSAR